MAVACYCCSFYRSFTRTCTLKAGVKGEGSGGGGGLGGVGGGPDPSFPLFCGTKEKYELPFGFEPVTFLNAG